MGGTIVSTILTLLVVPLVYYMIERKKYEARDEKTDVMEKREQEEIL
jgi:short subunit fatty acids transporter